MTGRTHRAVRAPRRLGETSPAAADDRTQGRTGEHSGSDPDVSVECAVLDAQGVGRVLGVGKSKVYELDARDELPAPVQVGRVRRWVKAEVEAWLLHGAPHRAAWARLWPKVRKEVMGR